MEYCGARLRYARDRIEDAKVRVAHDYQELGSKHMYGSAEDTDNKDVGVSVLALGGLRVVYVSMRQPHIHVKRNRHSLG